MPRRRPDRDELDVYNVDLGTFPLPGGPETTPQQRPGRPATEAAPGPAGEAGTAEQRPGQAGAPGAPAIIGQIRSKLAELARVAEELATLLQSYSPAAVGLLRPIVEAGRAIEQEIDRAEQRRGAPGRSPSPGERPIPVPTEGIPAGRGLA